MVIFENKTGETTVEVYLLSTAKVVNTVQQRGTVAVLVTST